MTWEAMTIDEYAEFHKANGAKAVKMGQMWWTEARPFFYRPLFPFAQVSPDEGHYPIKALLGGVMHLVPEGEAGNICMNLFLYDELQQYSIEKLGAKQRWIIRQGMKNFEARRISDVEEFISAAYPIYDSFYSRTRYFYKRERVGRKAFAAWAYPLFRFPKVVVMGAYRQGKLCAIDVSYRVEDVIIDDVFFSDTESQSLRVTDFLLHTLREGAAATDATLLFRGFPTGKDTLDDSKLKRGCKVARLPAYLKLNPVALVVGKTMMNQSYRKLVAMTSAPLAEVPPLPEPENAVKLRLLASQYFSGAAPEKLVRIKQQVANEVGQKGVAVRDVDAQGNSQLL